MKGRHACVFWYRLSEDKRTATTFVIRSKSDYVINFMSVYKHGSAWSYKTCTISYSIYFLKQYKVQVACKNSFVILYYVQHRFVVW